MNLFPGQRKEYLAWTLILTLFLSANTYSQNIESISSNYKNNKSDTAVIRQTITSIQELPFVGTNKADSLANEIFASSKAKKYQLGIAHVFRYNGIKNQLKGDYKSSKENHCNALNIYSNLNDSTYIIATTLSLASVYFNMGKQDSAIYYCNKGIKSLKFRNNHKRLAACYNTLGGIYWSKGDFLKAAESFFESLKIKEQLNDSLGMANTYNNIGILYDSQQKLTEALEMYRKSLDLYQGKGDKKGISRTSNNIAIVLKNLNRCGEAIEMLMRSLEIDKEFDNINEQGKTLNNIGQLYLQIKEPQKAINYFNEALTIFSKNGDINSKVGTTINLGKAYTAIHSFDKARKLLNEGLESAKQLKSAEWIKESYFNLYELNKQVGSLYAALSNYEKYSAIDDSLRSAESLNKLDELKIKFETDQKEKEILILSKENDLKNLEIKRQKSINWFLISISSLFILIAFLIAYGWFIIRRDNQNLRLKNAEINQQKEEIETQRDMLELYNSKLNLQNEEILTQRDQIEDKNEIITSANRRLTENIEYASRIQKALLPDIELIKSYFSDQFIIYKPKDIVSGDFFWMWPFDEKIIFSVADCTGHGVSGAFMSILAYNFLKDSIITQKLTNPKEIVNFICNEVENNLYSNMPRQEVKDGMDIIICCYDPKQQLLEFSGAHSAFTHVRDGLVTNYKTDRYSIGSRIKQFSSFTNQQIQLQKNDRLIFYTDGYIDQLDNIKRRKLGRATFINLIQDTSTLDLEAQKIVIDNYFNSWKGNSEQIDDILVWGLMV